MHVRGWTCVCMHGGHGGMHVRALLLEVLQQGLLRLSLAPLVEDDDVLRLAPLHELRQPHLPTYSRDAGEMQSRCEGDAPSGRTSSDSRTMAHHGIRPCPWACAQH